jgi:hypothetical protein
VLGVVFGVIFGALGTAAITAMTITVIGLAANAINAGKPSIENAEGLLLGIYFATFRAALTGAAGGGIGAASSTMKGAIGMAALIGALIGAVAASGVLEKDISTIQAVPLLALFGALTGAVGGVIGRAESRVMEHVGAAWIVPAAVVISLLLFGVLFFICGGVLPWNR